MQIEADDDVNLCDVIKPAMLNKRLWSHCRNSSGASVQSAGSAKASKVSNVRNVLCVLWCKIFWSKLFWGEMRCKFDFVKLCEAYLFSKRASVKAPCSMAWYVRYHNSVGRGQQEECCVKTRGGGGCTQRMKKDFWTCFFVFGQIFALKTSYFSPCKFPKENTVNSCSTRIFGWTKFFLCVVQPKVSIEHLGILQNVQPEK